MKPNLFDLILPVSAVGAMVFPVQKLTAEKTQRNRMQDLPPPVRKRSESVYQFPHSAECSLSGGDRGTVSQSAELQPL